MHCRMAGVIQKWPLRVAATAVVSLLLILLPWFYQGEWLSAQEQVQPYLVRLREDTVIDHLRRQPGYFGHRINLHTGEALRYRSQLLLHQENIRRRFAAFPRAEIQAQMDTVFNGFAVQLRPQDVAAVASLPEVAEVIPPVLYHKVLNAAEPLVHVPEAWADARIGGEDNAGAGVKIAVIDTGIDINHPMFQDTSLTPPAGFPRFTAPSLPSCLNSDQPFTNSKVIVARNYFSLLQNPDINCDAMDRDGHGTFVAGIAAGRRVQGPFANIAGVAPKAFLGSYKVFGTPGINDLATARALIKAMDDATKDGMDVINLSVGNPTTSLPDSDPLALAAAEAVAAGVTVVVAAGNGGPATGTVSSPAISPAVITVGATTNSRLLAYALIVAGPVEVPAELQFIPALLSTGPAITSDIGPAPLVDIATVDSTSRACDSLPDLSLSGRIALIRRGGCSFQIKIANAALAGATAVVVYNNEFQQPPIVMDVGSSTQIPSVMIGNTEGTALVSYLATAGSNVTGTLPAAPQAIPTTPDIVAHFSAAGPATDFGIKPDLVAPGVNIYSATQRNDPNGELYAASGFAIGDGTSFASPMAAGAAALLIQAFPSFSPAQIKSALVQSATATVTPFAGGTTGVLAYGNGLMDVAAALAIPVTVSPALISFGTNSPGSLLNQTIPLSIQNVGGATDTFTLTDLPAEGSVSISVSISPVNFSLAPGASRTVSIQATSSLPLTGTVEGHLQLTDQNTSRNLTIPYWGNFLLPKINNNGVVNAASFQLGPTRIAAGSLVSIFGTGLTGGATAAASSIPLPTSLAGIRVVIGGIKAPLLYVSPTQINAQIPQEVSGQNFTTALILLNGVENLPALVSLAPTGPGIFAVNQGGTGRAAILHSATQLPVTASDPAKPGEILEVYVNGLGATNPPVATGQAAPLDPLARVTMSPTALFQNVTGRVDFAGLAPSFVGLYQVNIEVPSNSPTGEAVPLTLTSNGVASNVVTVPIAP